MKRDDRKTTTSPGEARPPRKPYVPPAIESEEPFERQALSCGRKTGQPTIGCMQSPSS